MSSPANLPPPPVPKEVDLRGCPGFLIDVERLLASELVAVGTPEEKWAAFMLWCRAYQQSPPGSLPNDERVLAAFSGSSNRWAKIKTMALHGFILCSDGRLYHPVLCEQVLKAWRARKAYRSDQERLKKWRSEKRKGDPETSPETQSETGFKTESEPSVKPERRRREEEEKSTSLRSGGDPPPRDAKAMLWKEGLASLMNLTGDTRKKVGSQMGAMSDAADGDHEMLLEILREAEVKQPDQPYPWIMAAVKARTSPGLFDSNGHKPDDRWGLNAWIAKQPDVETGTFGGGSGPAINGWSVEHYAERLAEAAGLPPSWRGSWDCLGKLLREDLGMIDETPVLDAVRNQAQRMNGSIGSMAVFDATIRSAALRCRP